MPDPAQPIELYVDSGWISPWAFTAFVALTEKKLPFVVKTVDLAKGEQREEPFFSSSITGKIPAIRDGEYWLSESLAIAEYLAETYPFPEHPRLFPADLRVRGRARQVMLALRTDFAALRQARPSTSIFVRREADGGDPRGAASPPGHAVGAKATAPLSDEARLAAAHLVRVASAALPSGALSLCDDWCIADADLAFCLQRMRANGDALPAHLERYVDTQWARPSVRAFAERPR